MRANYNQHGVEGYYSIVSESYRNPHYHGLKKVLNTFMDRYMEKEKPTRLSVLDLAAGSGEATEVLLNWKATRWPKPQPPAAPDHAGAAHSEPRPNAAGQLPTPLGTTLDEEDDVESSQENLFDIVIVSFALHLVESSSELWALLTMLARRAKWLVVIAPHKKPDIKDSWGWTRWDPSDRWRAAEGKGNVGGQEGDGFEIVIDRVRLRIWRSEEHWSG
ncbi:hypothetical protein OIV83_006240 [Microbotryomycetes sp. JL201]|nr:hypothetical protein OIV83_006240 [Microbotryomycetes sp. JL201]